MAALAAGALLGCGAEAVVQKDSDAAQADPGRDGGAGGAAGQAGEPASSDRDGDGVCDDTERSAGSDLDNPDSDGDGVPDLNEQGWLFDPLDPNSPGSDRLLFLQERPGASVQILVKVWVAGQGESFTGELLAFPAVASGGLTAADLGAEVQALSARPSDQAFDIDAEAARFGIVQGSTELTFAVGFSFTDQEAAGCARGLAFAFRVKGPEGESSAADRYYLLVVAPPGAELGAQGWCKPDTCL